MWCGVKRCVNVCELGECWVTEVLFGVLCRVLCGVLCGVFCEWLTPMKNWKIGLLKRLRHT